MIHLKDTTTAAAVILGAIVIGAAGFLAGHHMTAFGTGKFGTGVPMMRIRGGMGMHDGFMAGGMHRGKGGPGRVTGTVTKVVGNNVTVCVADGTETTVTLTDDASVRLLTDGSVSDITAGQTVMIGGGGFWDETQTVIVRSK